MRIISKDKAKRLGLKRYFTGESCKNGHMSERQVSGGYCVECNKQSVKKWRKKTGYKTCPKYLAKWNSDNPERVRLHQVFRDRSKLAERNIRKRAALRKSTPLWLDGFQKDQIRSFYDHAKDCQVATGERYEVDHIVPIMGETVCGLHVPWNLQVLPMHVNRSKRNKLIMEY